MAVTIQRPTQRILNPGGYGVQFHSAGRYGAAPGGADWWDPNGDGLCIWAAYEPKGAASLAASYVDQSGNGNNAGVGVAPTWDAVNGWKFDGATQYLTTTFVPQNDQSQSAIVQFTNTPGALTYFFGCSAGIPRVFLVSPYGGYVDYFNGNYQRVAPAMVNGNVAVAGNQGYRNGVADGGTIGAWSGSSAFPAYIGCFNSSGAASAFKTCYIQALALYDCTLTAPQVAYVADSMADGSFTPATETRTGSWATAGGAPTPWACYQPKGAPGQATSYLDLSGNGNHAGVGVAPTWDAVNGWKFDGATQYLTTTFTPQNDKTQTIIAQYTNYDQSKTGSLFGMTEAGVGDCRIRKRSLAFNYDTYYNGSNGINAAPASLSGNQAVTGDGGYLNGALVAGASIAYSGAPSRQIWIGANNNGGSPADWLPVYIQALAIYDVTLTAPQVLAVASAMAAL